MMRQSGDTDGPQRRITGKICHRGTTEPSRVGVIDQDGQLELDLLQHLQPTGHVRSGVMPKAD